MTDEKKQEFEYEENGETSESAGLAEKTKKLKEKLALCNKEKQEYLAGWQRSQADFINYKRRQEEQVAEWSKIFNEGLLRDILPALDSLDASIKNSDNSDGLEAVKSQLMKILRQHGLGEIRTIGEKFNPELHEAVEQVGADAPEGTVVEETQKGYLMNGKVLRAAKVRVSRNS